MTRHPVRAARATAVVLAVTALVAAPPARARAYAPANCTQPGQPIRPVPWAQEVLTPERVWPFTRGGGVTVAVLATGIDARHPQLGDRVRPGFDAMTGAARADDDCVGLGTQVASVIAAQETPSVGLVGLAPRVEVVPVRVLDDPRSPADPKVLARGLDWAVGQGAQIVAVPVPAYADDAALRSAVAAAVTRGVIVVAAAGDRGGPDGGNPRPYPAAYDGVVGVGAIALTGQRWPNSQRGSYVDVVAPGVDVTTLQRGGGMAIASGTGVATGFAAGALALGRSKRGASVTPPELVRVMLATASPAPSGPGYGAGVVNPYALVTGQLSERSPVPLPSVVPTYPTESPALARSRRVALTGAAAAAAAVLLVLIAALALPRGRRRLWRPVVAPPVPREEEPEETGPPVLLFDERRPTPGEGRER